MRAEKLPIIPLTVDDRRIIPLTSDDSRIIPLEAGCEFIIPDTPGRWPMPDRRKTDQRWKP